MISRAVLTFCLLLSAPALAQPGGEAQTDASADRPAAAPAAEARAADAETPGEGEAEEGAATAGGTAPAAAPAARSELAAVQPAAAPAKPDRSQSAAARVGLRVRAATGSPVGEIARVTPSGVLVRMEVQDRPVLKLISADRLEVQGGEAVTDLTLGELEALPAAK